MPLYSSNKSYSIDVVRACAHLILLLWISTEGTWSVNLHELQVPKQIMNDSLRHVVLDCRYSLNHTEKDGMILKWYLNGVTIYQWIPPARPQGLGAMRGKIDLDYDVSPDPYYRHRALYLYWPTVEMTGDYTCKISTIQNEVSKTEKMTVYVKPNQFYFGHTKGRGDIDLVNISCAVDHAYPEPILKIYQGEENNRLRLNSVEERIARYPDGAWQKIIYIVLQDKLLPAKNTFECEMSLPHTNVTDQKKLLYKPKNPTVMASASDCSQPAYFIDHRLLLGLLFLNIHICFIRYDNYLSPSYFDQLLS